MYMFVPARSNGLLDVLDRGHSLVPKCYPKNVMFTYMYTLKHCTSKAKVILLAASVILHCIPFLNSVVEAENLLQVHVCHSK